VTVTTESMKTISPDRDVDARLQPLAATAHIKAIASRADLLSTLQVLRPVAKTGRSLPVVSAIMIVAYGNSLKITTDNCEIMCRLEVPAKIESEGAVVLSVDRLFRLLTYAVGDELKIDAKDCQSADLTCGDISAHFAGWPVSDFVRRADPQAELSFQISLADLKAALAWISAAIISMPRDQAKCGIHFFGDGRELKVEALDGRTLHHGCIESSATLDVVGPPSIINLVHALAGEGECTVAIDSRTIQFTDGKTVVCAQLLEEPFPDTSTVIPQPSSNLITLPKDALVRAINASLSVMDKKMTLGGLNFSVKKGATTIFTDQCETGFVQDVIETRNSHELDFRIDPLRLLTSVKPIQTNEVAIQCDDPLRSVCIRADNFLAVIALMRPPIP
jgi:DNA polymerase III subunit beta